VLILCTDFFTVPDVVRLMNVLMIKYNIECYLHYNAGLPRIYIPRREVSKVLAIVQPHMCSFFMYKLLG